MIGVKANRFLQNKNGFANLVPMVLVIIIAFAILFIGSYVNGTINQSLENTYPVPHDRTGVQNSTLNSMNNTSANWDSTLDIVQVVIIITVLAAAIGAIFLFTRLR